MIVAFDQLVNFVNGYAVKKLLNVSYYLV